MTLKQEQKMRGRGKELDPERGLTVVEITDAAYRGTIKAMYVMGETCCQTLIKIMHALH